MADMADAASHNELIAQFTGVTGVDAERAKFYLESAAWKLDVAIAGFYEDDDGSNVDPAPQPPAVSANPGVPSGQPEGAPPRQQSGSSRFGTIAGLSSGSQEDSDGEEGQAYYAGGSERGAGQQIIGPPKKKPSGGKFVQEMFDAAKEHGAEEVSAGSSGGGGAMSGGSAFRGMGFRLGDTESAPSESVMGLPREREEAREVDMVLKFWKNGFSVDDGPLREFQDDENKEFLDSIRRGEIPRELTRMARGGTVNLNMEDHRTEDFVKPKVTVKAFTGEGHKLGSPAPTVVSPSDNSTPAAQASAQSSVNVDSSKPTTSLQIRLSDGTRMVAKFNHSHTVSDVRTYITTAHPQFASVNFVLMTTFPNKELTDETQTLEAAKLLNAVLVQRIK